jgi:hypothetical protein
MSNEMVFNDVVMSSGVLMVAASLILAIYLMERQLLLYRTLHYDEDDDVKANNETDWNTLTKASHGILCNEDRPLLTLCQGNRHLLEFVGRTIYFCITYRGHQSTTMVPRLIHHLQCERWRERGDGLLETILEFTFDSDDEDYHLMKRCFMAITTIQLHTSVIPQVVCDMVVLNVVREEMQHMTRNVLQTLDDFVLEQVTLSTTNRIQSMLQLLGLADGMALSQAYWEDSNGVDTLEDWKDHVVEMLTTMYQHADECTTEELVCACTMLPSFLVRIRRYLNAQELLQDAVFCQQRSIVLGSVAGAQQHLADLKLLTSLSHQALVKLRPTVMEDVVLAFSVHVQNDGDCLYSLGCFLLESEKSLACFEVLDNARWVHHQRLEAPLSLVADALEHLGTLYLVQKEETAYSRYAGAATSLRTDPNVDNLYAALILYCKYPICADAGFIFRLERLLARLQDVQEILDSLLLTLQSMSQLPTDPDILDETSLIETCLQLIDGIRIPEAPPPQHRRWWWFAPTSSMS